jgi:hypothetical protein
MKNKISRASRTIVNFDKNATSCHDQILASLASLASRRHGVQRAVVMVSTKTLEKAKFKIKAMLGATEEFYQNFELFPIHRTGQGSGKIHLRFGVMSAASCSITTLKSHMERPLNLQIGVNRSLCA